MGLSNVFELLRVAQYEDLFLMLESQEKCQDCDGKGFNFNSNEFVLIDNTHKCSSCNGSGFRADSI
jgi:DnaJ-class molecular chaperone